MTTDEMKAAIEMAKRHECCSLAEYDTVMALAEVGRLAVEDRRVEMEPTWDTDSTWVDRAVKSENARNAATDAFLAKHGGGA